MSVESARESELKEQRTLDSLDDNVGYSISQSRSRTWRRREGKTRQIEAKTRTGRKTSEARLTSIPDLHPSGEFDVSLLVGVIWGEEAEATKGQLVGSRRSNEAGEERTRRTSFRESLRDHELRHVDFVLEEIRDDLLGVSEKGERGSSVEESSRVKSTRRSKTKRDSLLSPLHVSIDQHLVQARLDDRLNQTTVISSDRL